MTRLRSALVDALISAANSLPEEGRQAAEARVVDSLDAFFDDAQWKTAVQQMQTLKKEMPDIGKEWAVFEGEEARNLLPGHQHHRIERLFRPLSPTTANYEVFTSRGKIRAKHVVYATNAWTPHFVPGLQRAIRGGRLHMSAELGGSGLPKAGAWHSYTDNGSLPGGRAWSLLRNGLDYVVQMPRNGEYMFGGDINTGSANTPDILSDSGPPDHITASYLNGALSNYFGYTNWGPERTDFPQGAMDANVYPGRTKRVWVGIQGSSWDSRPFLGRLPQSFTKRPVNNAGCIEVTGVDSARLASWCTAL
ncbi:hypothetical protein J7T55_015504 [Diaporthe amygdali]|uniref:uncharacterized protein n=1 Tax=Phomopsis amygdali TaxID=1214568 RepID=UPI0022FE80DA|nr:uncharacterized protein J7T55_015504 [Diaporthe amygdali]KAJ0120771.1 hypothetical protein J7T55_015504 [Diaporthe amygdali]